MTNQKRQIDSIENMIAQENDPKQRAFLIVMNNMSVNLLANTDMIRDIGAKLESHLSKYELQLDAEREQVNQKKGMLRAAMWIAGIVQVVVIGVGTQLASSFTNTANTVSDVQMQEARVEERLSALERTLAPMRDDNKSPERSRQREGAAVLQPPTPAREKKQ